MKLFPLSLILSFVTMLATAQAEEHTVRTGSGQATVYVVAEDELHNLSRDRAEAVIGATSRVRAQVIGDTDIRELVLYPKGEARTESNRRVLTREVLVRLAAGTDVARLAREVGADAGLEIPYAPRHYILRVTQPGAALKVAAALATMAGVEHVEPVLKRKLAKRSVPNDPLFNQQWTLRNTGQNGATADADINVVDVWATYKGTGITVGVIDDGLEYSHPDLAANANTTIDYDFRDSDDDPKPEGGSGKNAKDEPNADSHGTATAGVIAARGNNGVGATGVAYEATLVGLRLIGGTAGDPQEGAALSHNNSLIHIYNNSWGPNDDGTVKGGAGTLALAALKNGVTSGRGGRGSIYVWAAGNGGAKLDNAGYDSYNGSIYTVSVAALNDLGQRADYSERGACLVVTAPSGNDATRAQGTTTTDLVGDFGYNRSDVTAGPVSPDDLADRNYTQNYNGTSSAAPVVSGVVALMLQANPNLGWRDVQEVLIRSATQTDPTNNEWRTNGAGFKFNPNFGAGRVNAGAAVALAKNWTNLPGMTSTASEQESLTVVIPDSNNTGITRSFDLSASNLRVEQTVVTVHITHAKRGELVINLVSPSGTISPLAELHDDTSADYAGMTFRSTFNWGEDSKGTWQVQVSDRRAGNAGTLTYAKLEVFGSLRATTPQYLITTFNPQPVAAGGEVTLTGTFPTGSVPVITLENASGTTVATLTAVSNTSSQIKATVPTGTASGTYGLKVKFGTASTSGYVELGITTFAVGTSGGTTPQYLITTFNPQPVAAGGEVTLTGTFPTGSVPVITLEDESGALVATLTPGSNSSSQIKATVPAVTASGTYGLKVKFGTAGASGYVGLGVQPFVVGTSGGSTPQYLITTFNPQPVAAGGEVTLTGTFPTGSVPVITLETGGTTVATLTAGSNTGSQIKATVPTGTASGTYGLKVKFGTAGASGYVELGITTFAVGTSGGAAPTITAQPANVTIPNSERTQLKVTATGTGTLTYQWYQGQSGITTTPVAGATTPTITTPALSATTSYWVRITDGNGVVTNSPTVTVTVSATSPLTVTQQVLGPGYHGGGAVVVTNIITYTGNAPSRIDWATLLPAGWKYLGSGGSEGGARPPYESGDLLDWSWTTVPASPIKFSYSVSVPAGTTGDQVIASLVTSQAAGTSYRTMAKPDPLVIRSASLSSASLHSADSDRDGRISLIELTRVIELYNYRSGTVRTGQYKPQAGTEDGFAPGPVTPVSPAVSANPVAPGGVVTLTGTFPADQGEPRVFLASSSGTTLDLILGNHSASSITATVPASTPVGTYELKVAFGTLNLGAVANFVVGTSGGGGGGSSSAVLRSGLGEGSALPADSGLALGVVAVSSGAATYAWTKSGSDVGSDVQKAFTVTSATVGDYRLALNGTSAESIGISIGASSALPKLITGLPNSVHVQTGQNVVLGISVSSGSITSGAPSFTGGVFAWAKDGILQAGKTENAWNLGAVSSSSAGLYSFYAGAGVPGPTTFAVSASGASAYVINGSSNPSLSVVRGQTYTFAVNASGHKLWIQSAAGSYSSSGTYNVGVNNNGTATGSIVWTVATDTPDTLYYICEAHSAMAGTISVSAPLGTGSGSTERLATSTQLVVGAAGNALLYGPGAGPAVIGSPLTITGSMVPGDGVSVVWERKPSGGTAFAAVSTASGSTYAAAASGSMHSLSISSLAAAMAGDQFRFVATRAGVSFTSEIYVLP